MKSKKLIVGLVTILIFSVVANITVYAITEKEDSNQKEEIAKVDEWVQRQDVEKETVYVLSDEKQTEKPLTYDRSRNVSQNDVVDVYKDESKDEFRFADNELTGYLNRDARVEGKKNKGEKITEEEAITIAKKHIKETYGKDLKGFELKSIHEDQGDFLIDYYLMYGENDFIYGPNLTVKVLNNGEVSYSADTGRFYKDFDESLLDGITMEKMEAYADAQVEAVFGDKISSHEIEKVRLVYQNDRYSLELMVVTYREEAAGVIAAGYLYYYDLAQ